MEIEKVCVLGSGTMGHGIAQVAAGAGYKVVVRSRKQATIESGLQRITGSVKKFVEKGNISKEECEHLLSRITITTDLEAAVKDADLIIESVVEDMDLKKGIFKEITGVCKKTAIIASNTSTLSITEMASSVDRPQNFVGMHFFNPVQLMQGVEIIRGVLSSEDTVELAKNFILKLGKTPIVVKDSPGFAGARLSIALYLEASRMLAEGVASVKDIDTGARLLNGHKMGPFETCDLVGLDARLNNLKALYQATGDAKWAPPLLLKQLVASGYLGKKPGSKGGYYAYFGL